MIKIKNFLTIFLICFLMIQCNLFQTEKENNDLRNLAILGFVSSNRNSSTTSRDMYTGFADIPTSIYKTVASGSSASSIQETRLLATSDFRFQNSTNTSSVSLVYDLVRITSRTTRDVTKSIGDLVKALEAIPTTSTLQGTDTWGGQPSKYRYGSSTTISGGRKLEVWWNNAPAPYSNNKAIEMNYTGSSSGGNITGYLFCRFLGKSGDTVLGKAYIKFEYNASTNIRNMVIILQDVGNTFTDTAHFFVKEENGVTTLDGGYSVDNYNPSSTGVTTSNRIYIFNAAGNSSRAVINAAFPLQTDTTTAIYANTSLGNIGQVWTNFILANTSTVTTLNGLGGSCSGSNITSTNAQGGNPTTLLATISVANVKTCLDSINPSVNAKDFYFITNIKNPAYFTVNGSTVSLYGVESLEASDSNKSSFDSLQNLLSSTTRNTSSTSYQADFSPDKISNLNLFTGLNVPAGTTANTLPSINAVWGNGTGTGTSTANATANAVNGSADNTAPF